MGWRNIAKKPRPSRGLIVVMFAGLGLWGLISLLGKVELPDAPASGRDGDSAADSRYKPVVTVTNQTRMTYERVPADFHPVVPDPLPEVLPLSIQVYRKAWSGQIKWIHLGVLTYGSVSRGPYAFEGRTRELLIEDFRAVFRKYLVLECMYRDEADPGLRARLFWWKKVPKEIEPARLRARMQDHPLLVEFEGAATQCPPCADCD